MICVYISVERWLRAGVNCLGELEWVHERTVGSALLSGSDSATMDDVFLFSFLWSIPLRLPLKREEISVLAIFWKADLLLPFFSCCLVAPYFVSASSQPVARQEEEKLCSAGAEDGSTLSLQRWASSDSPGANKHADSQALFWVCILATLPPTSAHLLPTGSLRGSCCWAHTFSKRMDGPDVVHTLRKRITHS